MPITTQEKAAYLSGQKIPKEKRRVLLNSGHRKLKMDTLLQPPLTTKQGNSGPAGRYDY